MGYYGIASDNVTAIIKATLLIVLSIAGNFLAETLGCGAQRWLSNMYVKHIMIIFLIYFTINFTQGDKELTNPITNVGKALLVWLFFHCVTHMNIVPTVISMLLIMTVFIISNYKKYYKGLAEKLNPNNKKEVEQHKIFNNILEKAEDITFVLAIITTLVGFTYYFIKQRHDHKNHFSFLKFIFGIKKCQR